MGWLWIIILVTAAYGETDKTGIYSPFGKRDPFREPVLVDSEREVQSLSPIEKYTIQQFQLKAILRGFGKPRALFEDPEGKTHILLEGDTFGRERGTISRILNTEVMISGKAEKSLGVESLYEKVISLPKDKETIK